MRYCTLEIRAKLKDSLGRVAPINARYMEAGRLNIPLSVESLPMPNLNPCLFSGDSDWIVPPAFERRKLVCLNSRVALSRGAQFYNFAMKSCQTV